MYRAAIAFVFGEFGIAKRVKQMVAERRTHDRIAIELVDGLTQRSR
jgi:hypothetical protein